MNNNIYMKYKEILNNQKRFFPREYLLEPVYLQEKQQKIMNNNIFNNSNKKVDLKKPEEELKLKKDSKEETLRERLEEQELLKPLETLNISEVKKGKSL